MNLNRPTYLASLAQLLGHLNPAAWDAIHPYTPFAYADAHLDLLAADLVRQVSEELADRNLRQQVFTLSQQMARTASAALVATWDEPGDELCPRWPFPFPFPHPHDWLQLLDRLGKPQPQPWAPIVAADQVSLAQVLTQAASLTSDAGASKSLLQLGKSVAALASRTLLDEFDRCGNKPRPKLPKKAAELLAHAA